MALEQGQIVITAQLNKNAGRGLAFGGAEGLVVTRGTISKGHNHLGQLIPKRMTRSLGDLDTVESHWNPRRVIRRTRHAPGRLHESVWTFAHWVALRPGAGDDQAVPRGLATVSSMSESRGFEPGVSRQDAPSSGTSRRVREPRIARARARSADIAGSGPAGSARAAYAAFMLQVPVLLGLEIAARPFPWPPLVKAVLVGTLAVAASFGLGWMLVRRTRLGKII